MREITSAEDAVGMDFLVVDNLLTGGICDGLAELHAANAHRYETPDESFWRDRLLGLRDVNTINPQAGAAIRYAVATGIQRVCAFYGVSEPLYADVVHLVGWGEGREMSAHADNANPDGSPHALSHRDFSGVVYLNDNFEGGCLHLPRQEVMIRPRRGMFVSLPAGLSHQHAVTRVERGQRTTMAFFLTRQAQRADPSVA